VLADRRVRHAIGARMPIAGEARPRRRWSTMAWAFEPSVHQFHRDLTRSKALLDAAGYRDPDGDGPQPRLRLTLKTSTDEFFRLQATILQQDLRQVGIDVDVRSYEFATMYADVLKGNFQMVTMQWVGVTDPDMLRRVFHSQQTPPAGFNRGYYSNPQVDRLIDLASGSLDEAERRRYYGEAQKIIADDAPYISLWYRTHAAVLQPGLNGLHLGAQANMLTLKNVKKGT
jgi:peptide/nickel transport system substrate-binding protein